jgi:hypothetical protein
MNIWTYDRSTQKLTDNHDNDVTKKYALCIE